MRAKSGGKRIEAAGLILAALVLGLSGLLHRESLAQPADDPQAQVQDAIADLKDEDPEVRRSAAEALGNIQKEVQDEAVLTPGIPPLITALQDEDAEVRAYAAEALGKIGRHVWDDAALVPGIPPLIAALQDEDAKVRENATWALDRIARNLQDEAALVPAIPPLIQALQDQDANVRRCSAMALAVIATKVQDGATLQAAIGPLIEALGDESEVVHQAALALANIATKVQDGAALQAAIGPLIEALGDETADVRGNAALALGRIARLVGEAVAERVLAAFTRVLHGEDTTTNIRAAGELARILPRTMVREPDAINPDDLCCAYVYLGYMADGQGRRGEAASWYRKVRETRGRTDVAESLLAHGAALNATSKSQTIALHWAAAEGHRDVVRLLLDAGADVGARNENGWTPLHAAARAGHQHVARLLLDAGADLRAENDDGWTPLHEAAYGGCRAVARLLLAHGADVGARDKRGHTPLCLAAEKGHRDLARLLLGAGADVRAGDSWGSTPLADAAWGGHRGVARLLLDAGADVRAREEGGWTPLHTAAYRGHQDVARLLLDAGADLRAKDENGWTPLHTAALAGHNDLVAMLLARAADSSGDKPELPVAVIQAEPTSGNVPLKVQFDGSTDPDDSIVLHTWAFGDGESAVGPRVAHFYPSEGTFQAQLTVTDYTGQTDTTTIAISGTTRPDKIAVVVDTDIRPLIQTRLDRYVADLEASGCTVEVREWMTGIENEPALLKQYLMSVPDITGAVFIGAIAPAYYEYDEDFESYACFPCDLYYMDFTATWSDSDDDSFFDTIDGEPYPAIWISRLYAANLEGTFPGLSRADLINRYLDKNHDFRTGALRLRDRALAYHDDVRRTWTDSGMSLAYSTVDVVNDTETTSAADMMSYWDDNYEYAWLSVHSVPRRHQFYNGGMDAGVISKSDVAAGDPQVLFWNLYACSAARFEGPTNCIGNCYIFAPTYGLSVVGSTKPAAMQWDHEQFFAPIAQGQSNGEALRRWLATHCEPIVKYKQRGYGLTLLGDGSLRIGRFMGGDEALQDDDRNLRP